MKIRSTSWRVGVLLLIGTLTSAEAAGPLTQVGTWLPLGSAAHDLVIKGNFAYVVTDAGLTVVDLTDPEQPVIGRSIPLGIRGLGIALHEDHLYVANQTRDLQIIKIDVSNPAAPVPVLVATKLLPGGAWDVAVRKDPVTGRLFAYVASFGGEFYVVEVTDAAAPVLLRTIGLNGWGNAAHDGIQLLRLNSYSTKGGGKVTGLSLSGDDLVIVEWAYGRKYYYKVTEAHNPIFAGTHYAPFTFRVKVTPEKEEADPEQKKVAYSLSAFGGTSGVYSLPLDVLGPNHSTRHNNATCPDCRYFHTPGMDSGGIGMSTNGKYVMYIGGKRPTFVQVLDVSQPPDMIEIKDDAGNDTGRVSIPTPFARTAQTMGLAQFRDEYIIAAAARLGLGVFKFPGLSDD